MAREDYPSPLDYTSPEEFYESYEDLFEDDDSSSGPCYLPEKNQDSKKDGKLGQENGEIMDCVMNSDESRNTVIEGCCLSGGQIDNISELNGGRIEENSAINGGQIEENSLHNEDQTDENINLNGVQIEGNSAHREVYIEENCGLNDGQCEEIGAIHEGGFEEKSTLFSGKNIIKENGISEAENVSGCSSGGYEAGTSTGVSTSSSLSSVIEEGNLGQLDDRSSGADWNGRCQENEDDTSITWRKRKKHFFILSHSGKPIYSRYGDENKLAGFSATLQAIISFVQNNGDNIKLVRAGNHQILFLEKGPVYLVSISSTKESFQALRIQLELLHGQMLLILTRSIEKYFQKNASFDMRPLLGGTDVVFSSLIHAFSWNPATFLHAYTCVPLSYATRQAAGGALQDIVDSHVLFAILMCRQKVISIAGAEKAILHPDDILLLSNFVLSTESFRTSESFSPICLPRYNPTAFLNAYVQFLKDDIFLVVLTTDSNGFYHLRDCRIQIESVLNKSNVLNEVKRSMLSAGLHVADLPSDSTNQSRKECDDGHDITVSVKTERCTMGVGGLGGLWHFMYKSIYLDQFVTSEFSPPLTGHRAQKRLLRAYENLYTSMHATTLGPHKMQYRRDENHTLLCWVTPDFELYAAFDPLAEKSMAIATCNRVCQWIRDLENEIFLIGAAPFAW